MDKFEPGTICYHKATNLRCVVIKITDEMVNVRDEKNEQQDYYPQELETETEINARNDAEWTKIRNNDNDWSRG